MKVRGALAAASWWRSPVLRRLLVLSGLAIVAVSLLADTGGGAALSKIGHKQVMASLAGVGILASGILLSVTREPISTIAARWVIATYLALCSFIISLVDPVAAATWALLGYAAAVCLLLPLRFGALTFTAVVAVDLMLTWISRIKVDLTGIPLTMLDIRIAVGNPAGLWDALSLPHWTRHMAIAVIFLALLAWTWTGLFVTRRFFAHSRRAGAITLEPWGRIFVVALLGSVMWTTLQALYVEMGQNHTTWHHAWVTRLADKVGILPFLAYSYHIESQAIGDIYRTEGSGSPPSQQEVRQSVLQYISFEPEGEPKGSRQPNILMVLAESTFDPSRAFRLQGVWNTDLFAENELTAASGPLRVNTKGGGTWVAEFETITGLDSRLFGYSGAYTHASLSPFVERSFADYLEERGYQTWAFLSTSGDFYNSRRAYESYGFQHVLDSVDLGSELEWFGSDIAVIESVKAALGRDPVAPFFSYIILIENHGPHECDVPGASSFTARFSDTGEFDANCALHEYLRRLDSTTIAVQTLLRYLQDIERRASRPFVLLIFGDHQPSTFTGSGEFVRDFAPFRTSVDVYTTFFHILSSTGSRLKCCSTALPVAALPTLASGFVASGPEDVYLGENLWLYAHCGSDAIRRDFADRMTSLNTRAADESTPACEAAYQRALGAYRSAGIVRLTADTGPAR